jgi:arabinan endo-1,5-alpha-L-arabinosidase
VNQTPLSSLFIRDPFVLPVADDGFYYLYGTNSSMWDPNPILGFDVYRSRDLALWEGPFPVFRRTADFWGSTDFWAPEVYRWQDGYIMLASATHRSGGSYLRGVQLFRSSSPLGPFTPVGNAPLTPIQDGCIDGTLHVDAVGQPWLIYSHERMQTVSGHMVAVRLAPDLSRTVGEAIAIFTGKDAPWNSPLIHEGRETWCAEAPWLHRSASGELLLFWSGFLPGFKYVVAVARSTSGNVLGPWDVQAGPLFTAGGGHGMAFRSFEGENLFILHSPGFSKDRLERARLLKMDEEGHDLTEFRPGASVRSIRPGPDPPVQ